MQPVCSPIVSNLWMTSRSCLLQQPMICGKAILFRCFPSQNRRLSEYTRHPVPPANAKSCHIPRRISTIGFIFSPDAMKWPALHRKTGCRLPSDTAFGLPAPDFSSAVKSSVPWRFRWARGMWICNVSFWWISNPPRCVARRPWACWWQKKSNEEAWRIKLLSKNWYSVPSAAVMPCESE